jgi:hypothetical protein
MRCLGIALSFLFGASVLSARADILYLQNFPVPPGTLNYPFTLDNWNLAAGAAAVIPPTVPGTYTASAAIDYSLGTYEAPTGRQTNAYGAGTLDSRTYYYSGTGDGNYLGNALCWTDEFSFNPAITPITTISWYHFDTLGRDTGNGNDQGGDERVALRINNQWLVAPNTDVVDPTPTGNLNHWWLDTFTFTPLNWIPLAYTPGVTLDTSITATTTGTTPLPDGIVTAFGLYQILPNQGNLSRFDTFTINTAPEPGTLMVFPLLLILLRRRTH